MTQLQLAESLRRSSSLVSRFESGTRRPSQRDMLELSKILAVPVQQLQQLAGCTPEFDWYASLAAPAPLSSEELLRSASPRETEELARYLLYLRFAATVSGVSSPPDT